MLTATRPLLHLNLRRTSGDFRLGFEGSSSVVLLREGKEARSQKSNPGPAIHLPFQGLEPVYLTFHGTVIPKQPTWKISDILIL
jgi:hypothetical protein